MSNCCACVFTQLCPTLCDPMDCGPPGSSAHGILLAGILEWVGVSLSRGPSRPRDRAWGSCASYTGRRVLHWWASGEAPLKPCSFSVPDVCSLFSFVSFARYMSIWFVPLKNQYLFLFIFRAFVSFHQFSFLCVSFSLLCSCCWVGWPN